MNEARRQTLRVAGFGRPIAMKGPRVVDVMPPLELSPASRIEGNRR